MIVFLGNMTPSIAFCSEEIADVGISLTSGYLWVGRKGSCTRHGRLQCGDRWERSTALRGKRLEAGCEWMGWQHLVLSTWGFQVWWIAGSISRCLVSSGPLWTMIGVPFLMGSPNVKRAFRFFECLISMKPPNGLEKIFPEASSIRMIGNFFLMVPDLLLEAITIQSMRSSDWCRKMRWCNTRISEILRFVDSPFWGQVLPWNNPRS